MSEKTLKAWRKGVTKNRGPTSANTFGLVESMERTISARNKNRDAKAAGKKMLDNMEKFPNTPWRTFTARETSEAGDERAKAHGYKFRKGGMVGRDYGKR